VAVEEEAVEEEADEDAEEDTEGIGGEVEPVAIAVTAGAILLQEFEESAHEDGQQGGSTIDPINRPKSHFIAILLGSFIIFPYLCTEIAI